MDRRDFLQVSGAVMAATGLTGCSTDKGTRIPASFAPVHDLLATQIAANRCPAPSGWSRGVMR